MITINKLIKQYRAKKRHPYELIKKLYLEIDKQNKNINGYLTLSKEKALDKAKKMTQFDKPLSGIPLAIKDNFCTKDLTTTASARLLKDFVPPYNATVIERLEQNGAIIIGKTNMDAWAHGSSTETSDFGTTHNPYDLNRVPGGSSGGSAAVVASGTPPFALGSETAGSIRQPSAWCGTVGLKPTYGRVSRYGLISMASSFDCPGPITRNVEDSALILQLIAGFDKFDASTSNKPVPNYLNSLKKKKALTIGLSDSYLEGVDSKIIAKFEKAIITLKKMGYKFKKIDLINPKYSISCYTILQSAEVSSNLCRYDGIRFGHSRKKFSEQAIRRMMLGTFTLSVGYYDAYYLKAQKVRTLIMNNFKKVFQEVDLIASPTTPTTALKIGEGAKNPMFGEIMDQLVEASSIAGLPGINLPIGLENNLPVGIQIFGPWFSEENIINIAQNYQEETSFYNIKPPNFYEL